MSKIVYQFVYEGWKRNVTQYFSSIEKGLKIFATNPDIIDQLSFNIPRSYDGFKHIPNVQKDTIISIDWDVYKTLKPLIKKGDHNQLLIYLPGYKVFFIKKETIPEVKIPGELYQESKTINKVVGEYIADDDFLITTGYYTKIDVDLTHKDQ
jgi:hypothetical protein